MGEVVTSPPQGTYTETLALCAKVQSSLYFPLRTHSLLFSVILCYSLFLKRPQSPTKVCGSRRWVPGVTPSRGEAARANQTPRTRRCTPTFSVVKANVRPFYVHPIVLTGSLMGEGRGRCIFLGSPQQHFFPLYPSLLLSGRGV